MPEISPALYRAGEGDPLVLIHGFTGTWHHWRPVLPELVASFEVIAPTLAGHDGGPPFETGGRTLRLEMAGDHLERHLDDLGVGTAHFAGNSLGGALALEMAKRDRARSVVALAPAGGWDHGSGETRRLARFFTRQHRLMRATRSRTHIVMRRPGTRRVALRDAMLHGELVSPPEAVALVQRALRCTITQHVIDALAADEGVYLDDLDRIACPVLLACTQHDRILPMALHSDRFRREIPDVTWHEMQGVGHVPMWDAPLPTAALIGDWARRHAGVIASA